MPYRYIYLQTEEAEWPAAIEENWERFTRTGLQSQRKLRQRYYTRTQWADLGRLYITVQRSQIANLEEKKSQQLLAVGRKQSLNLAILIYIYIFTQQWQFGRKTSISFQLYTRGKLGSNITNIFVQRDAERRENWGWNYLFGDFFPLSHV
jgi:hypothetical protein